VTAEEIRILMQQLVQALQQAMASGERLSDQIQGQIAQTFQVLLQRLEEAERPTGTPQQPPLTQAMPSSNVEGFAYNDKTGQLLVRFLGNHPNRFGPIYSYGGVPPNIFEIFRKGAVPAKTDGKNKWGQWWRGKYPSMGAAMYHLIRAGGYPYQRVG